MSTLKNITIKDVARECGLSTASVSYVLNNKKPMPEATKKLVFDTAKKLNYSPSYTARSLVMKKSNLFGIVIPQTEPGSAMVFDNPFYTEILSSIEFNARKSGYHIIISGTEADETYLKLAIQRNLDGIILIGAYPKDFYVGLRDSKIPIVLVDSYIEEHRFHSVKINDRLGGYKATKYLIENGHRQIAFVSGQIKEGGVHKHRFDGYCDALEEFKIPIKKENILTFETGFEKGMILAEKLTELKDVTGAFCTADILAMGLIKKLLEMGKKIPDDLSVVGFDNLNVSKYYPFGITTINQNIFEKGKVAVELLIESINQPNLGKRDVILPVEIVERGSVVDINHKK